MLELGPTAKTRFERHTDVRGEQECWEWKGYISRGGYGRFRAGGRSLPAASAHRVAYVLAKGQIPDGMLVMHACDNRRCVNPSHLSIGSYADNNHDMMSKGRFNPDLTAARAKIKSSTHCRNGHIYSAENTTFSRGRRVCKVCNRNSASARAMAQKVRDETNAMAEGA